jgi:hypothetical protein
MDESYFHYAVRKWYMPLLRRLTLRVRRASFRSHRREPSPLNRFFSWLFYRMGL